jgi:hypothetical protein
LTITTITTITNITSITTIPITYYFINIDTVISKGESRSKAVHAPHKGSSRPAQDRSLKEATGQGD